MAELIRGYVFYVVEAAEVYALAEGSILFPHKEKPCSNWGQGRMDYPRSKGFTDVVFRGSLFEIGKIKQTVLGSVAPGSRSMAQS